MTTIFPEKITISENRSRTPRINKAILLIAATDKGFSQNKKGQLLKNVELANQVDLTSKKSNQLWELLERIYILKNRLEKRQ